MAARLALAATVLAWLVVGHAQAQSEPRAVTIGFLEIAEDPRYLPRPTYAGIMNRPRGRPFAGAEVALRRARVLARSLKMRFALERRTVATAQEMGTVIEHLHAREGVRFFLVDADDGVVEEVARRTRDRELVLFNVSAIGDTLRGPACQPHLLHTIPSHAMLMDAMAQFLVSKQWREVLVLTGPSPKDAALTRVFERSARRFGLKIVATRPFILSNNPRERGQSNVALMTAGMEYDVVFLSDEDGEFGRYVPYQTQRPRPVVGTEGMIADAWHWSWERHGAPQLNQRFEKHAGRRMQGPDWAAWAAIRAIVESMVRTRSAEFDVVSDYLRSDTLTLDGYKGTPLNFRPWDNQLRQAIFLRTHNAVVAKAPLDGFLHPKEYKDTLGYDEPESECKW